MLRAMTGALRAGGNQKRALAPPAPLAEVAKNAGGFTQDWVLLKMAESKQRLERSQQRADVTSGSGDVSRGGRRRRRRPGTPHRRPALASRHATSRRSGG